MNKISYNLRLLSSELNKDLICELLRKDFENREIIKNVALGKTGYSFNHKNDKTGQYECFKSEDFAPQIADLLALPVARLLEEIPKQALPEEKCLSLKDIIESSVAETFSDIDFLNDIRIQTSDVVKKIVIDSINEKYGFQNLLKDALGVNFETSIQSKIDFKSYSSMICQVIKTVLEEDVSKELTEAVTKTVRDSFIKKYPEINILDIFEAFCSEVKDNLENSDYSSEEDTVSISVHEDKKYDWLDVQIISENFKIKMTLSEIKDYSKKSKAEMNTGKYYILSGTFKDEYKPDGRFDGFIPGAGSREIQTLLFNLYRHKTPIIVEDLCYEDEVTIGGNDY